MTLLMDLYHPTQDIEVRPARGDDVKVLAPKLRFADMAEIVAASGMKPVEALGDGFVRSKPCWTVLFKGEPSAMWGVVLSENVDFARLGTVWMLGSDSISLWGKSFHRLSMLWMKELAKDFDVLHCIVDARQGDHLRWLLAIGFRPIETYEHYGPLGLPFYSMAATLEDIH